MVLGLLEHLPEGIDGQDDRGWTADLEQVWREIARKEDGQQPLRVPVAAGVAQEAGCVRTRESIDGWTDQGGDEHDTRGEGGGAGARQNALMNPRPQAP